MCYPLDRLREEVAYLAYHLNWTYDDVMEMEHAERQEWLEQVAHINAERGKVQSPTFDECFELAERYKAHFVSCPL